MAKIHPKKGYIIKAGDEVRVLIDGKKVWQPADNHIGHIVGNVYQENEVRRQIKQGD